MSDHPRPVWPTQADMLWLRSVISACLAHVNGFDPDPGLRMLAAWDAAPADANRAIATWFDEHFTGLDEYDRLHLHEVADSVLRALGMPEVPAC